MRRDDGNVIHIQQPFSSKDKPPPTTSLMGLLTNSLYHKHDNILHPLHSFHRYLLVTYFSDAFNTDFNYTLNLP